jgi:hypothetical protein
VVPWSPPGACGFFFFFFFFVGAVLGGTGLGNGKTGKNLGKGVGVWAEKGEEKKEEVL